ncbi:chromosome segregation protein Spc25-domain-containing protein [Diplogelasinospora grovesii]|uniref:Kinetochore protein SPC25 n=1 Tax=Diplogelasinospora grovesii TaxID=303347 RepID=A0AAN6NET7_9PEZI|nr:chromosome segregation protein Spc25-domain-containing protein [Diplogelasinospora grovesii]
MATLFEPTLSLSASTSSRRPPLFDHSSHPSSSTPTSMADTLPSINFGFDELRDRMAKFTAKFDAFIEQGRKRVLEERNQFRMNVAELQEDQRMKKKDIEILQLKTNSYQQTISKEAQETREMQAAISTLSIQRDRQAANRDALKQQIEATQKDIDARLAAQREYQAQQDAQARYNVPELDFWVTNLCLRIEGAGVEDRLKFVYTHVDEKNWEREAWFELCTGSRDYDVKHCRPKLEREKVEKVLDKVNESRELVVLLKGMRELFVEAMKS